MECDNTFTYACHLMMPCNLLQPAATDMLMGKVHLLFHLMAMIGRTQEAGPSPTMVLL